MQALRPYFAILLLLAATITAVPRGYLHHCEDLGIEHDDEGHHHDGPQVDHPDCELCSIDLPLSDQVRLPLVPTAPQKFAEIFPESRQEIYSRDLSAAHSRGPPAC